MIGVPTVALPSRYAKYAITRTDSRTGSPDTRTVTVLDTVLLDS